MSYESLLLELAARVASAEGEQETSEATLAWLGAVWGLFDAGVISAEERQCFYGELHRARSPEAPKRSGDPAAFRARDRATRAGTKALEEYERHPERLPPIGPWLPEWVLFPKETGREPELLLVEGYESRVGIEMRIGGDGTQVWRPRPPSGQREPPASAEDDIGTAYHMSWGSQSGRMVRLWVRPAPPRGAQRLRIRVDEVEWSVDLSARVGVATLTRAPVYLDAPDLCKGISADRGQRAARLRLALRPQWRTPRFESAYLARTLEALRAAGQLSDEPSQTPTPDQASELHGEGLQPIQRAVYFQQPETVGVRLLAAFASACGVKVRWAQLPSVYGPQLPAPWILPSGAMTEVRLADDRGSPYVAAVQEAGGSGFWDPPFWHGQTTFVTDGTPNTQLLEAAIGDKAAQFSLG